MKVKQNSGEKRSLLSLLAFLICVAIMVGSFVVASLVQGDFGRVDATNVICENFNGIPIRAKLLRPVGATKANPMPGIVHIHGYQNNRETGDAYCIDLARRGFVVLNIDAIGRGNSGMPNDPKDPTFDKTYGGLTSLKVLRSLPFVLNLFHIIGVLIVVVPLSTWFYHLTGKIYLGALLNALIVTWMFGSSQVVAPIPV